MPVRFKEPELEDSGVTQDGDRTKKVRLGMLRVGNTYKTTFSLAISQDCHIDIGGISDTGMIVKQELPVLSEDGCYHSNLQCSFYIIFIPKNTGAFSIIFDINAISPMGESTVFTVTACGNALSRNLGKPHLRSDVWEIAKAPDTQTDTSDFDGYS
eukprot:GHVR01000516.1.p1 GENE.GHVR01000516.1~~GHVR01000516.1.p1  ORF type:complete len:156 (+),score=30.41 GHVR01000516.1:139-606(+)